MPENPPKDLQTLPFGFARPDDSPGFLLWQTTMAWQRQIKKVLEPHGLSHAQFVLMATLLWFEAHGYERTQTLMVRWSKLDKMTVSQALKKLAERGWIRRREHPMDTRAKEVTLTEEGKKWVHLLVPQVEGIDRGFFGKLSKDDQKGLIPLLAALSAE